MKVRVMFAGEPVAVPGLDEYGYLELGSPEQLFELANQLGHSLVVERWTLQPTVTILNEYVE